METILVIVAVKIQYFSDVGDELNINANAH